MLAIFVSLLTLSILDLCQRTYHSGWTQGNLDSLFYIDHQAIIHNNGIIGTASIKSLRFISAIPVHFIQSTINVCKYYFVFISLIFIFHIIVQSFKETPPSQVFPGAIPRRGINTENSVIRGNGVTLKDRNPTFGSVSTPLILSRPGGERKEGAIQLFLICIWWYIWSWKLKCQILLQRISDASNIFTHHAVTIEKKSERKKFNFSFCLVIKMVLDPLKWLRKSFYEKKKEIIKTSTFAQKESS